MRTNQQSHYPVWASSCGALRPRFGRNTRATAWILALVVLAWIVSVAILKDPMGFIVLMLKTSA